MYCAYQDREALDDDLYRDDEGDSGSEANSELEFHLYSQLHYSSNTGEVEEQQEDGGQQAKGQRHEATEGTDGEQEDAADGRPPSPSEGPFQKQRKKKGEKPDKQKKGKSNTKAQKSPSLLLEEVIVIASSPDVITLSEGDTADDDDDGVCASKGCGSRRLQTSTPAQQLTQKRKWDLEEPVTVDSSSSESDSEESDSKPESDPPESDQSESDPSESSDLSDSSDSDGLENWMILGRENQDGDQSISLNLEGGSDSSTDAEEQGATWLVSDKDREAQIYNKDKGTRLIVPRLSNRYYTTKNVQCRNCDKHGHLSKNCPEPKKLQACFLCGTPGHLSSQCPNKHCNNCGLPGHLYDSCSEKAYWHKQCHRCGMTGHFFDACPEIWRQYLITTKTGAPVKQHGKDSGRSPAFCYNCGKKGHFGHACTRRRMFNGTYPTTPFINHFDTVDDISRRQQRMKQKAKDLEKSGFLFTTWDGTVTPGPPKKKKKTSHYKNFHQHHAAPHKANRSHIFFKDACDVAAPGSNKKHNNHKQQENTGNGKAWKPKRPVPATRGPPAKLIFDEADDFPRGKNVKKKTTTTTMTTKKKKKTTKAKPGVSAPPKEHKDKAYLPFWAGEMSVEKPDRVKKKKNNRTKRVAGKKTDSQTLPTDENLLIIKQRKRHR